MGSRGPLPTPHELRVIAGGRVGRIAADLADGVHPPVRAPRMPRHVVGEAAAEWRRMTPELLALGLLTENDAAAFANYCCAWRDVVLLRCALNAEIRQAKERGESPAAAMTRVLPSGITREAILLRLVREAEERLERALAHFGLSPATRARVTASRDRQQLALGIDDPTADKLARLRALP